MVSKSIIYKNLAAEMAREGYGITDIAGTIEKSYGTARNKLHGISELYYSEGFAIKEGMFPDKTMEYLFERSVS